MTFHNLKSLFPLILPAHTSWLSSPRPISFFTYATDRVRFPTLDQKSTTASPFGDLKSTILNFHLSSPIRSFFSSGTNISSPVPIPLLHILRFTNYVFCFLFFSLPSELNLLLYLRFNSRPNFPPIGRAFDAGASSIHNPHSAFINLQSKITNQKFFLPLFVPRSFNSNNEPCPRRGYCPAKGYPSNREQSHGSLLYLKYCSSRRPRRRGRRLEHDYRDYLFPYYLLSPLFSVLSSLLSAPKS